MGLQKTFYRVGLQLVMVVMGVVLVVLVLVMLVHVVMMMVVVVVEGHPVITQPVLGGFRHSLKHAPDGCTPSLPLH